MKRSIVWMVVICAALTLALSACRSREKASENSVTQTIEPATPQPDTDTVMLTQTVDVEKGRSEVEGRNASGADITATDAATASTTTTTTTTTSATTTTR